MNHTEVVELHRRFLAEEGYVPRVEDEEDILFKFEGGVYFIRVMADDLEYFRLVYPNFWPLRSDEEAARAAAIALSVSADFKVAKVFTTGDDVSASVEMFCSPPQVAHAVFARCLRALQAASGSFCEQMQARPQ
jgi:hypothetical protein